MATNLRIRIVLMSATLAAELYQAYFEVPHPAILVGSRRFPVAEVYIEDLDKNHRLPPRAKQAAQHMAKMCSHMKCNTPPSNAYMEKAYTVVTQLAVVLGHPGSSVLIFVPGMNDIVTIQEEIEKLVVSGRRYKCFPIHSDIPFDDQMAVFQSSAADEVKIIIATNAVESSVTLPDVDNVICLGLCKQISYNPLSHRKLLLPTWISKASATQRAGRTGRVRPGTVYRLYTRSNYEDDMDQFELGEMVRIPLDSVILTLKGMLHDEEVKPVLMDCLEPPNLDTIERSFDSLFRSRFLTSPDETSDITSLGTFVSHLGLDLALGSLIGLGIQFGVAAEAVQIAGILSCPQTPWVMSSPLVHEPEVFNRKYRLLTDNGNVTKTYRFLHAWER